MKAETAAAESPADPSLAADAEKVVPVKRVRKTATVAKSVKTETVGAESATAPSPAADADNVVPVKRVRKTAASAKLAQTEAAGVEPAAEPTPSPARARTRASKPATAAEGIPRAPRGAKIAPAGALPPAIIPPEALVGKRNDRLVAWMLGISLAVHAVLLSIHFAPIVMNDLGGGPPLEIALVNARTTEAPTKADILAQANLDGGGNTDEDRKAKSPLPVLPMNEAPDEFALAAQKVRELEQRTAELLTQLRSEQSLATIPQVTDAAAEIAELPSTQQTMERTLDAAQLEAQIAKDMDTYQKRPKRRFIGARAEEYRFARYVEDWRLKVERVGNLNYPEAARAQKLYGSLVLTVSIRADGSIEAIEVTRPSGERILDAAAVKIVEMAAPYAVFPPEIRADTDVVHITRTWSFTKGNELVSR